MSDSVHFPTTSLDFTARYSVDGYSGVTFYLLGYATAEEYDGDFLGCEDENCDHRLSEGCWVEGDTSIVTDLETVRAVMVGDDREHLVSVDDLVKLEEGDYCGECGQTGCVADGRYEM